VAVVEVVPNSEEPCCGCVVFVERVLPNKPPAFGAFAFVFWLLEANKPPGADGWLVAEPLLPSYSFVSLWSGMVKHTIFGGVVLERA
jgi:hypothetical protein